MLPVQGFCGYSLQISANSLVFRTSWMCLLVKYFRYPTTAGGYWRVSICNKSGTLLLSSLLPLSSVLSTLLISKFRHLTFSWLLSGSRSFNCENFKTSQLSSNHLVVYLHNLILHPWFILVLFSWWTCTCTAGSALYNQVPISHYLSSYCCIILRKTYSEENPSNLIDGINS